jgi:hypothetical protein
LAGCVAALATMAVRAPGQRLPYSTHDWQMATMPLPGYSETWADVKTPGDGRTYVVGTTWVTHTDASQHPAATVFSTTSSGSPAGVLGPPGLMADAVAASGGAARPVHVAILQVSDAAGAIVWQRFFHGDQATALNPPTPVMQTVGRGISVFPGASPAETRIAICGETHDLRIPYGQGLVNTHSYTTQYAEASGFVAVYDGEGTLLWTYHFHGVDPDAATVLTDVSIHLDDRFSPPRDVVTYCGLSRNGWYIKPGTPGQPSTMDPLLPFVAPPALGCGDVYPGGDSHNAFSQQTTTDEWDGIVGRLWAEHVVATPPLPVTMACHSIVGGWARDGLFGIAEKSRDEFAVVGVTMRPLSAPPATSVVFPLTKSAWNGVPICLSTQGVSHPYMHGVVVEFDAADVMPLPTVPPTPLRLVDSQLIGGASNAAVPNCYTVARDILYQGDRYYVVGSTTDPNFPDAFAGPFVGSPCSLSTGYILKKVPAGEIDYASWCPEKTDPLSAATGAVGVAAWNEYFDHVAVVGWVQQTPTAPRDVVVASLFRDTTTPSARHMARVRQHVIAAGGDEVPGAVDINQAWANGSPFFTTGLTWPVSPTPFVQNYIAVPGMGDPAGGGLGVDPRGTLTVVGHTFLENTPIAPSYPVVPPPPAQQARVSQVATGQTLGHFDAIRSVVDMLPDGVCRSDGTGSCPPPGWTPAGNGGTTPACALSAFGSIVGTTPALQRMFVDYEGVPGPGQPVTLIVDRPPPASWVVVSGWQVGFPSTSPLFLTAEEVEIWVPSATYLGALTPLGGSVRESLGTGLPSGAIYACQYICLLAQPLAGTPCTGANLTWAATPAMAFGY